VNAKRVSSGEARTSINLLASRHNGINITPGHHQIGVRVARTRISKCLIIELSSCGTRENGRTGRVSYRDERFDSGSRGQVSDVIREQREKGGKKKRDRAGAMKSSRAKIRVRETGIQRFSNRKKLSKRNAITSETPGREPRERILGV